ncbi:MAG: hypothetical protein QW292_12045 [Candidatus Parvarchaeota archaeon]
MHKKVIESAIGTGMNLLGGCIENSNEVKDALTLYTIVVTLDFMRTAEETGSRVYS